MAFLLEKGHIPKDELRSVYHSKFRRTAIVISNKCEKIGGFIFIWATC